MFAFTAREQMLLAGVLCAAVLGAAVKHWRDGRRVARLQPQPQQESPVAAATPSAPPPSMVTPSPSAAASPGKPAAVRR